MLTEREVQELWALGLYRRRGLRTEDGRALDVVFAGFPGTDGPDFKAALLVIAGEERTGDVEVHLTPSGWAAHGHAAQHSYANVVLHVALRRDPFAPRVLTSTGRDVPELVLEPYLDVSEVELRRLLGRPVPPPPGREAAWLDRLGERRFERAAARLARLAHALGPEEALYRDLMAGLGYRVNKAAFSELARLVPWPAFTPDRVRAAALLLPWRLAVRPANRPDRRLEGMIRFVRSLPGPLAAAARAARDPVRFFDPEGAGLIGHDRALALWTSVIVPALGDRRSFQCFPAIPGNRAVREAQAALGVAEPETLQRQWGLLEWRSGQG